MTFADIKSQFLARSKYDWDTCSRKHCCVKKSTYNQLSRDLMFTLQTIAVLAKNIATRCASSPLIKEVNCEGHTAANQV